MDVLLDFGLDVEVRYVCETAFSCVFDTQQGREDEVLNADFLCHVGNILALGLLNIRIGAFPVVCDEEDGVRAL